MKSDEIKPSVCAIHCEIEVWNGGEPCRGKLITKRSVFGAVVRACELGWVKTHMVGSPLREVEIQVDGWPEIIREEELV